MKFCSDCHADGPSKGDVELDKFKTDAGLLADRKLKQPPYTTLERFNRTRSVSYAGAERRER